MFLIEEKATRGAMEELQSAIAQRDLYQAVGLKDLLKAYEERVIEAYMKVCFER